MQGFAEFCLLENSLGTKFEKKRENLSTLTCESLSLQFYSTLENNGPQRAHIHGNQKSESNPTFNPSTTDKKVCGLNAQIILEMITSKCQKGCENFLANRNYIYIRKHQSCSHVEKYVKTVFSNSTMPALIP